MNRVRIPRATHARLDDARQDLLNHEELFDVDHKDLYIKHQNKLVPIGGACKQNALEAGDNIEIIRDGTGKYHLDGERGSIWISETVDNKITVRYVTNTQLTSCYLSIADIKEQVLVSRLSMPPVYQTKDYEDPVNKLRFEYENTVSRDYFLNYRQLYICLAVKGVDELEESIVPQGIKTNVSTWKLFTYGSEAVRLVDNVDVDTVTLSPDGDNTYKWKGTIKLGELHNDNAIFILTKKTDIKDEEKALIGGEILIKMTSDKDEILYNHYTLTCTSTGSWSLAGAGCTASNVRMCRCKHLPTQDIYYGLRLPKGEFENFGLVDEPEIATDNLSAYVGLWVGNNVDDLWFYSASDRYRQLTKEVHLQDFGLTAGDGYSRDIWTLPISEVDSMLGWSADHPKILDEETTSEWKDWLKNEYKLGMVLDTKDFISDAWLIHAISDSVYMQKTGLTGADKQTYATYTLYRGYTSYQLRDIGMDRTLYNSNVSNYNHWYVMSMSNFFRLLNITPQGQWKQYNNNNYLFGIRIYTNSLATRITLVAVLRNNSSYTQVKVIGADDLDIEFNWDSDLVNLKSTDKYPWEEVYPNINNYGTVDIFKFIDRSPLEQRKGVRVRAIKYCLLDKDNQELDINLDFTKFDQTFLVNNYNFVSNLTNNRTPIFTTSEANTPILFYRNQDGITDDDCTSLLGIQRTSYDYVVAHHITTKKYLDNLVIKDAEFWFNGWKHIPDELTISDYVDDDWEYTVLSNKSNDNDSYAETRHFGTVADYKDTKSGLSSMQDTGEDNAPYKIIITQKVLSMQDLKDIADCVRHLERQVALDLSECTVANDAKVWDSSIFEGCVSLREMWIPQGVEEFGQGIFKWCTYLRKLDLTPSADTLHTIGGTAWEQNAGFLVSTRVTTLLIPKNVSLLRNYLIYSSNIKRLIFLHDHNTGLKEDQANVSAANRRGTLSCAEWAWVGQSGGSNGTQKLIYELPEGFQIFVSKDFWENGRSLGNSAGQPNKNGSGWDWYPNDADRSRWNKRVIDSIIPYPQDGDQKEWQAFAEQYNWTEDMVNEVRRSFGYEDAIEIKETNTTL